ncbi:MAG: hypothetical protein ACO3LA_00800 [Ilumatobacteraceae bacterium]
MFIYPTLGIEHFGPRNVGEFRMKPKQILQATTLLAAAASLVMSVYLYFSGDEVFDRLNGIYVGVWVPSILSLGAFLVSSTKEK